jgi:hypothetical protein
LGLDHQILASNSGDVINPRQLIRGLDNQKGTRGAGGWPVGQVLGEATVPPGGRTLSPLIKLIAPPGPARHGRTRLLQQLMVR